MTPESVSIIIIFAITSRSHPTPVFRYYAFVAVNHQTKSFVRGGTVFSGHLCYSDTKGTTLYVYF